MEGSAGLADEVSLTRMRNSDRSPIAINKVRPPIQDFLETEQYKRISGDLRSCPTRVFHAHGYPGSGKSELVRKLAQNFPFTDPKPAVYVKWHIQCLDSCHDVKAEIKKLIQKLQNRYFLKSREDCQDILESIDSDEAHFLVDTFHRLQVPVLIIIEDMTEKSKSKLFVDKLLNSMADRSKQSLQHKIHVYLTTRKTPTCVTSSWYAKECVTGFTEEEGIKFLLSNDLEHRGNETYARKVFSMFSGSPLGLRAARGYCKCTHRLDYGLYLKDIENEKWETHKDEEEYLKTECGYDTEHIFRLITMHFQDKNNEPTLTYKILSSLSYLHYDRIPRRIFDKCYQLFTSEAESKRRDKFHSGMIIDQLLSHEICTENKDGELTFHKVVLHAFRQNSRFNPKIKDLLPLKNAIWTIASIVTKDLTETKTSTTMYKLLSHGQQLLKHIKKPASENLFCGTLRERHLLMLTVSYLFESIARIRMSKSPADLDLCESYFECALKILWNGSENLQRLQSLAELEDQAILSIATKIVQNCKAAGQMLDLDFVTEWESKLLINLDFKETSFLEKYCSSPATFRTDLDLLVQNAESGNCRVIELLRRNGLFLEQGRHNKVFFVDRIASILHTWSRILLFKDSFDSDYYRCHEGYSKLSHAISVECRESCGIRLLSEHMSVVSGMIPIILKNKSSSQLRIAKEMCEQVLNADPEKTKDMICFQHGLRKEVYVYQRKGGKIPVLRNLVRIHTRLDDPQFLEQGNETCRKLLQLAKDHLRDMTIASTCIVNCAKYYASKKCFEDALKCTQLFLTDAESNPRSYNKYAWGVYNHARLVFVGELLTEKNNAISKCQEVLQSNESIGADLNKKLADVLEKLKRL